ncbi:MAG: sigma-70 family RNA polymerase sigma factor [Planctomycetota bacterium]
MANVPDTCWTLIRRAAEGDRGAHSQFGRSYDALIRAYLARRWRNTPLVADVDDAAQEVFLECLTERGPLGRADPAQGFRGFLLGIVRHVAQRHERGAARRHERAAGAETAFVQVADDDPGLTEFFDRQWALTLVQEARELLEQRARAGDDAARLHADVLDLRFAQGLPVRTIAARLQMDVDAAHRAYAKARERFRGCLRQVVAYHAVRSEEDLDAECQRVLDTLAARPRP